MSEHASNEQQSKNNAGSFGTYLIRFVLTAIVISIISFFTPGFTVRGWWPVILAAVIITLLDWIIEKLFNTGVSPFGNGLKGFIITVLILYFTQFLVPDMKVTIWGAIIASIIIGIIDALIPGKVM